MSDWSPSQHELDRRGVRRRLRLRSAAIATGMTVVVLGGLAVGVHSSPGWPRVHESFFNGFHARAVLPDIWDAIWLNIKMFLIAEAFILVLAMLIAMARVSRSPWLMPVRLVAVVYTDVIRGIPTILLVFLCGFGMPSLRLQGLPNDPFFWATVALVVSYSAYVAEVFRSGIESVHPSQLASARRSGSPAGRRCGTWSCRRRCAASYPRCSTTSCPCRRTPRWPRSSASSRRSSWRATTATTTSTTRRTSWCRCFFVAMTVPLARLTDWLSARARRREFAGAL